MMGRQPKVQNKLFYTAVNLEQRVRKNHILSAVKRLIDFDFIYHEVKDQYGINGNESVAPPVILKMMLLLTFYNVRSWKGGDIRHIFIFGFTIIDFRKAFMLRTRT